MDVITTDAQMRDLSPLSGYELDVAFGSDENSFQLTCSVDDRPIEDGAHIYAEGTEYGGINDAQETDTAEGVIRYSGRSWHGVLAAKRLLPDPGEDYLGFEGEANEVLAFLIARVGLSDLFEASTDDSGIRVVGRFDRYTDAYSGICKMLTASGAKLKMACVGPRVRVWAAPIGDYSADGPDSDRNSLIIKRYALCTNHLVCAGTGELRDRVELHLYADREHNVSQTQTLFGADEITAFYDYSNAEADELLEQGIEKLKELQEADSVELTLDPTREYDIGDIVGGSDPHTGLRVTARVSKKIVTVEDGDAECSYQIGGTASASSHSLSGSSESSGGGRAYAAGKGISIVGLTILADVDGQDLADVKQRAMSASTAASNASAAAGDALQAAQARLMGVRASSPLSAVREGDTALIAHLSSGVEAGPYGSDVLQEPAWGGTVDLMPRMDVTSEGHIAAISPARFKVPSSVATAKRNGLMSAADKSRLDSLAGGEANGFLAAHPVGCIYETTIPESPAVTYGGTWEPINAGMRGYLWERTA